LAERACALAGRNLTKAEWEQFIGRRLPAHLSPVAAGMSRSEPPGHTTTLR